MGKKDHAIFGGAVFCDNASRGASGKIDCRGVFTSFWAWAYPTSTRTWHAIVTLYNLTEGTTSVTAAISLGRGKKTTLAHGDIQTSKGNVGNVVNMPLRFEFPREGLYTMYFNIVGTTTTLKVPLRVNTQAWPHFTKTQLELLERNPRIPHSVRANVVCSECGKPYVFEESVLPEPPLASGVRPFPDSGVIECEVCKHRLNLKDIQGQVRSSIKTAVAAAVRGEK